MPYILVAAFSLIASWAASTHHQEIVPYDVAPGVILDTGADRTSITFMPAGAEIIKYVDVRSAGGVDRRPVVKWTADYYGCAQDLEVSVRGKANGLADVLLGRDFIDACNFKVDV